MDALKQNKFWVIIIVALVALVGVFAGLVLPAWAGIDTAQKQIKGYNTQFNAMKTPAGDPDIQNWEKYRGEIIAGYKLITDFYVAGDRRLERWFPGFSGNPNRGAFMIKYRDEIKSIETALGQVGTKIGLRSDPEDTEEKPKFGFNWEEPTQDNWAAVNQMGGTEAENAVLKELQKRFWARQRLASIIVDLNASTPAAKVKVSRVVDFRFFKPLHRAITNAPWDAPPTGSNKIHYRSVGMLATGFAGPFNEQELPNQLGKTLTFGFTLDLPYSEVPRVIREMLNPAAEPGSGERLLLNVIGAHVTIRQQNDPIREFTYPQNDRAALKAREEEEKENVKPLDVRLSVSCQMIDFDPDKVVKDFSKMAEEAAKPPQ